MSDTARLEFVKITVADLDAATAFYATALQQIQTARFELGEGEDALEEVIMGPQGGAGQNVVLVQYKTPRVADAGSTVLGFGVTGIKTVLQRVKRAGGSVVTPPKLVAALHHGCRRPGSGGSPDRARRAARDRSPRLSASRRPVPGSGRTDRARGGCDLA